MCLRSNDQNETLVHKGFILRQEMPQIRTALYKGQVEAPLLPPGQRPCLYLSPYPQCSWHKEETQKTSVSVLGLEISGPPLRRFLEGAELSQKDVQEVDKRGQVRVRTES